LPQSFTVSRKPQPLTRDATIIHAGIKSMIRMMATVEPTFSRSSPMPFLHVKHHSSRSKQTNFERVEQACGEFDGGGFRRSADNFNGMFFS
jgi:hypothetical protein